MHDAIALNDKPLQRIACTIAPKEMNPATSSNPPTRSSVTLASPDRGAWYEQTTPSPTTADTHATTISVPPTIAPSHPSPRHRRLRPTWAGLAQGACATAVMILLAGVRPASAHVKWFCAFDVAGQPRGLENVLCADFEVLVGLSVVILLGGCLLEATPLGAALLRAMSRATSAVESHTETMIRATCGFFFVALWTLGGIMLTPELRTQSTALPWLQLAIAAGMLSRRTLPLSAVGIVILFAAAVHEYGLFHLMDYPIFLGVAAYLACTGLAVQPFGLRPLDLVRWAAGITLMWASVEKWAYPQWSFPLVITHPAMTMGYEQEFFMRAAGVIEFTFAFALLWTPLVRRVAALVLAGVFIMAILEFGKVDAIGHSAIIAVLLAVAADAGGRQATARRAIVAPLGYGMALTTFLAAYYLAHAALFGSGLV